MLSKACKSVIAVTILFFLVNADLSAQMGAIEIGMARFTQNNDGVINVDLVNKNTNFRLKLVGKLNLVLTK